MKDGRYASIWNSQRVHRKVQEDKKEEINVDGKQIEKYDEKTKKEPLQK
jgi:hypothetical protein